ncbi:MAG: hypothetical protein MI757_00490, partial [Pirellulales bacterium]|nr:hypothetical protein [Pirellulales bacterium]
SHADASSNQDPFRANADASQPSPLDDVEDAEAIASIKGNLDIDLYSGTLLDDAAFESGETKAASATKRAEEIAAAALADSAERLDAEGQSEAARLVREAAKHLPVSTAKVPQDTPPR